MANKICDFNGYRRDRQAEAFADLMLEGNEIETFKTTALSKLLSYAITILYFSGDVEPGGSRKVEARTAFQLTRAASTQLFSIEEIGDIIRVCFDADYIYDIYLISNLTNELRAALLNAVSVEIEMNQICHQLAQLRFNEVVES